MKKVNIKMLALVPLFTALSIAGAYISIVIQPIPITFQLFFCVCAGLLLGSKYGALSQLLYALLGLVGLPVFSGGLCGPAAFLSPTFGYIVGFPIAAFVCGLLRERWEKQSPELPVWRILLCALAAIAVDYLFGIGYLYFISNVYLNGITLWGAIAGGAGLFVFKDIALCVALSYPAGRLLRIFRKM